MTGIERLRTLAGAWDEYGLGGTLEDVARQIERERACDADTIENVRLVVGRVIDDMERHVSGVEGADDSPVARWARELRSALKSDASDERDAQNPSWHDPAETAGVTSEVAKVTRDPAEDVSMSAYDLLPEDEREAIAWVRERGGLDAVKKLLDWVVGHCSTEQQLDFDFWLSGRVMHELGFDEDMLAVDAWNRRSERTCQIVVSVDRSPASYGGRVHRCSSCGKALPRALFRNGWTQLDYCPRCGARVTEVVRDAD